MGSRGSKFKAITFQKASYIYKDKKLIEQSMRNVLFSLHVIMIFMISSKSDAKKDNVDLTIDVNGERIVDASDSSKDVDPALVKQRAGCQKYLNPCVGTGQGNCCKGLRCMQHNPNKYCTNLAMKIEGRSGLNITIDIKQ